MPSLRHMRSNPERFLHLLVAEQGWTAELEARLERRRLGEAPSYPIEAVERGMSPLQPRAPRRAGGYGNATVAV